MNSDRQPTIFLEQAEIIPHEHLARDQHILRLAARWLDRLEQASLNQVEIFSCGPHPMLEAVAALATTSTKNTAASTCFNSSLRLQLICTIDLEYALPA